MQESPELNTEKLHGSRKLHAALSALWSSSNIYNSKQSDMVGPKSFNTTGLNPGVGVILWLTSLDSFTIPANSLAFIKN